MKALAMVCLTLGVLAAGGGQIAAGQENPPAMRKWTDSTGKYSVVAEMVKVEDETVHLKKEDGTIITVDLARLREADRRYLASLEEGQGDEKADKPPAPPEVAKFLRAVEMYREFEIKRLEGNLKALKHRRIIAAGKRATAEARNPGHGWSTRYEPAGKRNGSKSTPSSA